MKFVDVKCPENEKISTLLEKYLNSNSEEVAGETSLEAYKSCDIKKHQDSLKQRASKKRKNRFFRLDTDRSLLPQKKKKKNETVGLVLYTGQRNQSVGSLITAKRLWG